MKIGTAFQTKIFLHHSWLWLSALAVGTLVLLEIEPFVEAIVAALLVFGSILLGTLVRLYTARRVGVEWSAVLLFPVGAVTRREQLSTLRQQATIASAELSVYIVLTVIFGWLWSHLPMGALGIEMEIVALYNAGLALYTLLLRVSPQHDNLLHAILSRFMPAKKTQHVMNSLNSLALSIFAVASVLAMAIDWWAFGLWFAVALMLSHVVEAAERMGEYREAVEFDRPILQPIGSKSADPSVVNS